MHNLEQLFKEFPYIVFNEENENSFVLSAYAKQVYSVLKSFQTDYKFEIKKNIFEEYGPSSDKSFNYAVYFYEKSGVKYDSLFRIYQAILARLVEF